MNKGKVCVLLLAVLFVGCGKTDRVLQTKTEEIKNMKESIGERFNNCSDHAFYVQMQTERPWISIVCPVKK